MSYGKCVDCDTNEGIVYSGTAAFILECIDLVEKICYDCANKRKDKATRSDK